MDQMIACRTGEFIKDEAENFVLFQSLYNFVFASHSWNLVEHKNFFRWPYMIYLGIQKILPASKQA